MGILARPARTSITAKASEKFRLSVPQSRIWNAVQLYRFVCVCAGRRGGKSTIAEKLLIARAASEPNQLVWYVAPTYRMAKRLMWERLKRAIPKSLITDKNESELRIVLLNGSSIWLFGADNSDRLVGDGVDFCVIDEAGLMKNLEKLVETVLRPALADKQGQLVLTTTPRGFNYFYELCCRCWNFPYGRSGSVAPSQNWWFYSYSTIEGGNVTADELAELASTMSPKIYRQEIEARFETPAGRVYENYDFEANRLDDRDRNQYLNDKVELLVGIDFNVNPMSAVVAVARGEECHVIDAIEVQDSNTEELAKEIKSRYPGHPIIAFPDPSGRARKTSAPVGVTDLVILNNAGFMVIAPPKAPPVVDRVNAVNAMLCSKSDQRRLLIHPKARALIKGFNGLCYKEGTSIIDKDSGLDHITDCIGYVVWSRFNLFRASVPKAGRVY